MKKDLHKYVNSIRLAVENWLLDDRFEKLMALLDQYPGAIGRIALFTSIVHTPPTLEDMAKHAEVIEKRMGQLKELGYTPGINVLCTIGHHNENMANGFQSDAYRMTGINGDVCQGSFCLRDERFLNGYIVPLYQRFAKTGADFIWIDDDVRYWHMGSENACFCDGCIQKFNEKHGYAHTRETLRKAFNERDMVLRKQWLAFNEEGICQLFRIIGRTVRSVSEDITLGFMTGDRYFENYAFESFAKALSEDGKYHILWRPGGGASTDFRYEDFIRKILEIGRQNENLPEYVDVIHSEIENFPYQLIKKSPFFTANEGLMYMTSGCTGAAFNILTSETLEPIEGCIPHLKAIDKVAEEYTLLHQKIGGLKPVGIGIGWRNDAQAYTTGDWTTGWTGGNFFYANEMFTFGLPEAFGEKHSVCRVMNQYTASMLSDEEVLAVLAGGVYMDAEALQYLNDRGFGEYTGFALGKKIPVDARELYLDHPFNGEAAGGLRNCRQAFNEGPSFELIPTSPKAVPLSKLVDYQWKELTECTMGIFENKLGGRIAVAGYYPFTWISDLFKTQQLVKVFEYLSHGKLLSFVDGYCRLRNSSFQKGDQIFVTLINPSPDLVEDVPLMVATEKDKVTVYCGTKQMDLTSVQTRDGYKRFIIPEMDPWKVTLVEA